ncbi:xanthine dehydrogenase family protein molybdopterin-binding subunit [Desulfosarcina ovata]|uniref:Dehydrogenase n=1 Tax=Desulfosarcina ovata subsp. ovata TaxID=2752305 RepID=A0A5K8AI77_9BACT|nr:xanthine dehydrogenase family protein molybdopterin-binding subunit [Desulfosarcina ovata]BBO92248.1 dehydrogenase [Desulfosarcina ovata subsp. ovata]
MSRGLRHIGKETARKDARDIVTGKARFFNDVQLPGMLHGKVLRSPHAHANLTRIDVDRARTMPGVRAVLTHTDIPRWEWGIPKHMPVLDDKVRFVGDAVALVAADTPDIAEAALELIDVEYETLPAVFDVEEAMTIDAPPLYPQYPNNTYPDEAPVYEPHLLQHLRLGDVEKGFAQADYIIEDTCGYEIFPNPLPPEPPGVIATWETPDCLTIYTPSQSIAFFRFIGIPFIDMADMRAISTQCGGSYGTKNANLTPVGYAAQLAKATGKPVKIYYTKEEHFHSYSMRLGSRVKAKVGIKKDGTVTAISGVWMVNTGSGSESGPFQIAVGLGEVQLNLRCANWDLAGKLVCTNRSPSGIVRGYGGQELESSILPIIGRALEKADIDPIDFFKKNSVKPGDGYFWREGNWWTYRGVDFNTAIDKGAEAFGWQEKWQGWGNPTAVNGTKRVGVGVGVHSNADVGEDSSEALIKLTPDGRAVLYCCVSEAGLGQRSSLCKMVAEVLDMPLERVDMSPPDTHLNPFEFGLMGSRGTYAVGSAVIAAAEDARQKLLEHAAIQLNVTAEQLETKNGKVHIIGRPEKKVPWHRILGLYRTITGKGRFEPDYSLCNFLMSFVEVEVDTETGQVSLTNVVNATDCGQIISPKVLNGQLHGAFGSAGLDTALFEESVLDEASGRMLNGNMVDYKWRTFTDLPNFTNVILETPIPSHRFKAVGVGEIATSPGPSAVLMAVYNAIGTRITSYPVTADKILNALGKIKEKGTT